MDMCLYFSIFAWVVILLNEPFTLDASTTGDIILTPVNSQVIYSFNSSEPVCNSPPDCDSVGTCCTCEVFVSSPSETILNVTFLALQIPSDDTVTFINRNTSEDLLSLSGISSLIDPIYSDSSHVKISFDWCDGTTPYSYLEAEFLFLDRFQDSLVRSSGGAFELSDAYPSITIQSVNLSSSTDLEGQLHWFITSSNYTWIKIETLVMEPGQGMLCIFDTFDTYGEWVCMTDSVSSTTWYSHDDEMRMTFYINQDQQPGVGVTVKLSIIDHLLWTGQYLILPACNPTVIQEYTQTIQFVTPYFNQSLQNVRYQCRMRFTSRDAPASVEFKHFDLPDGTVSIYSLESGNRVDLADAQSIQVDISSHSPVVSLSPTHEMILDVYKHGYPGDGNGLMVQAYTFDPGPEPIASFGIAIKLNDTSSSRSFTTLGYPILPGGDINVRWFIDRVLPNTTIKVQFIDFHIGTATLFIREMDDPPIYQLTGYSLPDDIYSHTQMLTLVLRSDQPCCTRGFYFNVTLIQVVDECTNAPCENGGTCIDTMELFSCSCPNGFIGSLCQNAITTVGLVTELPTTQQGNTADTTIATLSASTFSETSTPVKSTLETSTSRTADLVTTSRIETSTPVIPTLETSTSRTTSCIVSEDPSPDDDNILIIALISLTIAFCLIAFLMCMMVYRISTLIKAPVAASTNHSSQIDLVATNTPTSLNGRSNSINVHNYDDVPPPTPPPEEHEYDDVITETDQRSVQHERTTPRRGLHQNPPAPITPAYVNVGTGFNRFRNEDPVTVHDMRMNGTSSSPLYANTEQTTVFHR